MNQASVQAPALPPTHSAGGVPPRVRLWPHFLVVFALYAAVYGFMFRGVIDSLPELTRGDSVLSFDEMVPIFDSQTQFWDQVNGEFSDLTNSYEFRVRYSFLTTWMRYYNIVPFTIIATAILSTYAGFVALTLFLGGVVSPAIDRRRLLYACSASALLINAILIYSKITHFYTLVLGFDLFLAGFLLLLAASFGKGRHPLWMLVVANLLMTLNPGVHYIVIYCIVYTIVTMYATMRTPKEKRNAAIRDALLRAFLLAAFTIAPYGLLVKYFFLSGFENLHDTVPVNYFLIRNTSIPLIKQLSLDITSIMDNFLYGQYSPPYPRIINVFYFFVAALPFIPTVRDKVLAEGRKDLVLCLGAILLLSIWFSLGYSANPYVPTFHRALAVVVNLLYALENRVADIVISVCATAIEILRFPHRFQFISFAVLTILMPLGILHAQDVIAARMAKLRKPLVCAMLLTFFFVPLLSNWSYRTTFLSGNFNNFLEPYPLTNLKEVKNVLDALPEGKTIVLPPSEAQKRTTDENGVRHKFIDKFFIYYLNKPSYHFGQSGTLDTKNNFFFMLWAIMNNEDWWLTILREQDVKYIVISKEIGPNSFTNSEYLKNIEEILKKNIRNAPVFLEKKFENTGFMLYEITSVEHAEETQRYLDLNWSDFRCYEQGASSNAVLFDATLNSSSIDPDTESLDIVTNDKTKAEMDVFAKTHESQFFRPDIKSLAFNQNLIPSSLYFNIIYSMFNVFSIGKYNYLNMLIPGTYDSLTSSFVGLPKKAFIKIPVRIEKDGEYNIYLRSMPTRNDLEVSIDSQSSSVIINNPSTKYIRQRTIRSRNPDQLDVSKYTLEQLSKLIPRNIVPVNNAYRYTPLLTATLKKGTYWVSIDKKDDNPLVLEGILLREKSQMKSAIPLRFTTP